MLEIVYLIILVFAVFLGLHRVSLVIRYLLTRRGDYQPLACFRSLPTVTVQLPIYNEPDVAERVIQAVTCLDYPSDKLEIQVLDDSTDGTELLTYNLCCELRKKGIDIKWEHRKKRNGFKAGALAKGLLKSKGEFIAIFDADFVPSRYFLKKTIHFFTNEKVGMVQTRWGHLNRSYSWLTRAQAALLDGHFQIEHTARNRSNCFFNFNGTAGIWRKKVIEMAGGWSGDTLTEDLDLSYRAQIMGSQFLYLVDEEVPAELPEDLRAFKTQQHRWTKGSVQVLRKLLVPLIKAPISPMVKIEALFHFIANFCYPAVLFMGILLLPLSSRVSFVEKFASEWLELWAIGFGLISVCLFYLLALVESRSFSCLKLPGDVLAALLAGIGLSFSNTLAVIEGLFFHNSEFVRTPKNGGQRSKNITVVKRDFQSYLMLGVEMVLTLYFTFAFVNMLGADNFGRAGFFLVFLLSFAGFSFYGTLSLFRNREGFRILSESQK